MPDISTVRAAEELKFRDPVRGKALARALERVTAEVGRAPVSVMHVCGSHEQSIATLPRAYDSFLGHDVAQIAVDMFGDKAQRHFAQGSEVTLAEKIPCRPIRFFAKINFSFDQASPQLVWRQINENNFISQIENGMVMLG